MIIPILIKAFETDSKNSEKQTEWTGLSKKESILFRSQLC